MSKRRYMSEDTGLVRAKRRLVFPIQPNIIQFEQTSASETTVSIDTQLDYKGLAVSSASLILVEAGNSPQAITEAQTTTVFTGLVAETTYNVILKILYTDVYGEEQILEKQITATTDPKPFK